VKTRAFFLAAVLSVELVSTAHGAVRTSVSVRPQTTVPDAFVTVHVTITDAHIKLDRRSASRGDDARFVIRNIGKRAHTFTLGSTARRASGERSGFTRTLKPREEKLILLFLDYRGPLPYRSTMKYDLDKPGMKGTFRII
jgi:hypothetical protein